MREEGCRGAPPTAAGDGSGRGAGAGAGRGGAAVPGAGSRVSPLPAPPLPQWTPEPGRKLLSGRGEGHVAGAGSAGPSAAPSRAPGRWRFLPRRPGARCLEPAPGLGSRILRPRSAASPVADGARVLEERATTAGPTPPGRAPGGSGSRPRLRVSRGPGRREAGWSSGGGGGGREEDWGSPAHSACPRRSCREPLPWDSRSRAPRTGRLCCRCARLGAAAPALEPEAGPPRPRPGLRGRLRHAAGPERACDEPQPPGSPGPARAAAPPPPPPRRPGRRRSG